MFLGSKLIFILGLGVVLGEDISPAVDMLLINLNDMLDAENKTFLQISDFIKWPLNCHGGTIGNLSTIYRAGPVEVIASEHEAYLRAEIGLEKFLLHFASCSIYNFGHDPINLEMDRLSARLIVTLEKYDSGCFANLKAIKLNLSAPKLRTGKNIFHILEDKIIKWLLEHFESSITRKIYKELWSFSSGLSSYDICKPL